MTADDRAQIDGIFFDFDGTLVDTWRLYVECYRRVLEEHLGRKLSGADIAAMRPKAELRFFLDPEYRPHFDALYARFMEHYAGLHDELCEGWYPGAREAAAALLQRGAPSAIITGKSRSAFEISARACRIPDFGVTVCDDEVNHPKPDPEGLLRAARSHELAPERILYIGDTLADAFAAANCGAAFGAALWAKTPEEQEELRAGCAGIERVWTFEEPGELLAFVD